MADALLPELPEELLPEELLADALLPVELLSGLADD